MQSLQLQGKNNKLAININTFLYLATMDWRMLAKGVTPMPVATRTACWLLKMVLEGALCGPEMWTVRGPAE